MGYVRWSWDGTKKRILEEIAKGKSSCRGWLYLAFHLRKALGPSFPLSPEEKALLNEAAAKFNWKPQDQEAHEGPKGYAREMVERRGHSGEAQAKADALQAPGAPGVPGWQHGDQGDEGEVNDPD